MNSIELPLDLSALDHPAAWPLLSFLAFLVLTIAVVINLRRSRSRRRTNRRWIILDGSNILYWKDKTPKTSSVREVIGELQKLRFAPVIIFDANAGYLVAGRYLHNDGFARLLGISADQVMVVPKGQPADPFILSAARKIGAQILTNDRYRDWAEDYPEVNTPGHLIKGGFGAEGIWLDLPQDAGKQRAA